jgi:hypothetical protein
MYMNKTKKKLYYKQKTRRGGNTNITEEKIKEVIPQENNYAKKSTEIYTTYLNNVNIDQSIKIMLMEKAFKSTDFFNELYKNIHDYLPTNSKKKWVNCINDCYDLCSKYSSYEIHTTPYILRALSNSVIGDKNYKISFTLNSDKLTGQWKDDCNYIQIHTSNPSILHHGRLIMGFGPSSSGKSYCANKIIDLMTSIDPSFPQLLISIDGSIYRQSSIVYQCILEQVKEKELYDGISNLVSSSIFGKKSIFKSDVIKKIIKTYLKDQTKHGFISNLYVPETLGGCIGHVNCKSKISDYINITGDHNWIGLMIYQHTTPVHCPYHDKYKCKGTDPSGKERELVEGKKYSSKTWSNSYNNGSIYLRNSPNYRFRIHNSGSPDNSSIFEDLSIEKLAMSKSTIQFFKKNNWLYINGDIKKYPKCNLFRNDC